jgi:hypothetical protein
LSTLIEAGIEPLVNALNQLDFIKTIYSCEGHFDRPPNNKFLPTAYVTFSTTDLANFKKLYKQIYELDKSLVSTNLRITYDCLLGLYTLSIWADISIKDILEKRGIINTAIARLSDAILNYAPESPPHLCRKKDAEHHAMYPCRESAPPCALVIPLKEPACPFIQSNK